MNWKWPLIWSDERGGWWRVPVTCLLFAGGFFVLGLILMQLLIHEWGLKDAVKNQSAGVKVGAELFLMVLPLCASAVGCLLGIKVVHKKPVGCVFTDGRPFQVGLFWQSCVVWAVLWLPGVLLFPGGLDDLRSRWREIQPSSWPLACLTIFTVIFFQAAAEEIVDRGYLQTRLAAWVKRPWLAVCISTTIFAMLHTGEMNIPSRVCIVLIGLSLGVALIRANTIAPLIGMHATDNALGILWLPDWTNTNRNALDVVFLTIQLGIWLKWLFWVTRNDHRTSA